MLLPDSATQQRGKSVNEQPLIDRWSDAETWLRTEARHCTIRRELPASVAFAFHDGQASALIETPTFSVEDADLITDELCRFLPQLNADQLLVMGPGAYDLEQDAGTLWVLRAHLGDRDDGWRTLLHPLPFDQPDMATEPIEIEPPDPWSARIHGIFDIPVESIHESAVFTPVDDRFLVAVHPDGPLAAMARLFGFD